VEVTKPDPFSSQSLLNLLKAWHKLQQIGVHPLASLKVVEKRLHAVKREDSAAGRGLSLRDVIQQAVESLKPNVEPFDKADIHARPYVLLTEEYFNGLKPEYIQQAIFNVSARTYQRARQEALERLLGILRQMEDEVRNVGAVSNAPFLAPPKHVYPLIGRYNLVQEVVHHLLDERGTTCSALSGLPGGLDKS